MCGLVAGVSKTGYGFLRADVNKFTNLLIADSIRGPDSTGVFGVNKQGNVDWIKEKGNPYELIDSTEFGGFKMDMVNNYQMVVGHNRKATVGATTDKNAHPFAEEHIILVHNGSLTNHTTLTEEKVDVDSHAIVHSFVERGYKETLKDIQGAFALIWFDAKDKALRFVRNDQRPLWLMETKTKLWLVSEWEMGSWILGREDCVKGELTYQPVTPGVVHTILLDKPSEVSEEEVEFHNPKSVQTTPMVILPSRRERRRRRQQEANNKSEPTEVKKEQAQTGMDFPLSSGQPCVVCITDVVNLKPKGRDPMQFLKGFRVVDDPTPVFVKVTEKQMSDWEESKENYFVTTIDRVIIDDKSKTPLRIMAHSLDHYEPEFDVRGEEVMKEEWDACSDHKCDTCGKEVSWDNINKSIFKFKTKHRNRITCPTCYDSQDWRNTMYQTC